MTTTVLLADDYELVRSALCRLVNYTPGFRVIAECADGMEAMRLAREHRPDIFMTDINMPVMNGLTATALVVQSLPATNVLVVSAHTDRMHFEAAAQAGAKGYLVKRDAAEHIGVALRLVRAGKPFISPSVEVTGFRRSDRPS